MIVAVVGSREFKDVGFLRGVCRAVQEQWRPSLWISGGCQQGADALIKSVAEAEGWTFDDEPYLPAHHYHPDDLRYRPYHVSNYHQRNSLIARDADILFAFCKGPSPGTQSTIRMCQAPKLAFDERLTAEIKRRHDSRDVSLKLPGLDSELRLYRRYFGVDI